MTDIEAIDFFKDPDLVADPYPHFEALRSKCPVHRENHYDVVMVTGYDEALEVYNDPDTFSSCLSVTGPFPGFPVPLEGDDISDLIVEHRDSLPMSDQLPTLDPPVHTAHRGLLMRLITPKRLKENEAAMWHMADGLLDTYLAEGEGEYIKGFAGPFTMLIIADLLGVPDEDRGEFAKNLHQAPGSGGGVGGTKGESLGHSPLEYLYQRFSEYVEDRRRHPQDDVLTGLATATFPDGSTPEVIDVVRVAANLFAAGQETTVRLLSTALKLLGDDPELQQQLREHRELVPNFVEECLRYESPVKGDFRLSRVRHHRGRRRPAGRDHRDGAQRRRQPRPEPLRRPRHVRRRAVQRPPAAGVRPGHPHLPRRTARPRRGPRGDRAHPRPHRRHPHLRARARSCRRPAVPVRPDVHPAWPDPAAPRVRPGRRRRRGGRSLMRVAIDEDLCRGHGVCCSLCPEVFDLSDDGYATVLVDEVPPEHEEAVTSAVTRCPERAIARS